MCFNFMCCIVIFKNDSSMIFSVSPMVGISYKMKFHIEIYNIKNDIVKLYDFFQK